jgi:hypothetical protein
MRHQWTFKDVAFGRNRVTFRSLLPVLLLSVALSARADDQIRAVRLSNVVGSVQIMNGAETQFSQAYPNMPLMQGSTLKTGEDGRAEIQFEDGSVVRLTPNTSAVMAVLGRNSDGNTNTEVDLLTGLSYVEMKGTANQRFVVHFGANEVISPAPVKFRVSLDANPTEFAVLDGSAHLTNGTAYSVEVRANETVRFDATDSSRYFLAQGIDGDSWDQWNIDRDQAMSQMAMQETHDAVVGNANPGDPAWSDLDYYGDWYASGSGGSVWVPNGAGAGWDPYGSGYWGYYGGGAGYVWISGYPWGWLPYHCGSWSYYNSFGWGWAPGGGCGRTWYPVTGIGVAPWRYRRIPRPVSPVQHSPQQASSVHQPVAHHIIAVDRGAEATTLTPRVEAAPKTLALNGEPAHLMPKTVNSTLATLNRPGQTYPGAGNFRSGANQSGVYEARPVGSVPVYRPAAPTYSYHPVAPSYSNRTSGGTVSAPHYSAPPAPVYSAPSHASSSAGTSSGGHSK